MGQEKRKVIPIKKRKWKKTNGRQKKNKGGGAVAVLGKSD